MSLYTCLSFIIHVSDSLRLTFTITMNIVSWLLLFINHLFISATITLKENDITKIIDEHGFTLVHLACYVNSWRSLKVLFDHVAIIQSENYLFEQDKPDNSAI